MRTCQTCNKPYTGRNSSFCSRACRAVAQRQDLAERFWTFVTKIDGCWEWQGARDERGYGIFTIDGKNRRAHRIAYKLSHGDLPLGLVVRHSCDNPPCVNPDHLLGGTQLDNIADREARGRTAKGKLTRPKTQRELDRNLSGERNGRAKLTQEQVIAIRQRYAAGNIGARPLAEEYGVSRSMIRFIVQGKAWIDCPDAREWSTKK